MNKTKKEGKHKEKKEKEGYMCKKEKKRKKRKKNKRNTEVIKIIFIQRWVLNSSYFPLSVWSVVSLALVSLKSSV